MRNSSRTRHGRKRPKPHPDFPLFQHATGRWCKKVLGRFHYFGKVSDDPDGKRALGDWLEDKDDLLAGRTPRPKEDSLTIADLCNHFLTFKEGLLDAGELAPRTFERYHATCVFLVDQFGRNRRVPEIRPEDFRKLRVRMSKRWGPVGLGNEIQMIRSIFRYGEESDLLDKRVRFGPGFKKPSAKTIRQTRAANGPRLFTPQEIHKALEHSTTNMRAMILLGINGALGNTDLGELPISALDLKAGWLDYPRPKTGVARRIPLWPETVEAIRSVLVERPQPKNCEDEPLLFIGPRGQNYVGSHRGYRVTAEWERVSRKAGLRPKRATTRKATKGAKKDASRPSKRGTVKKKKVGRTFYDLRRSFQTVAEGAFDLVAVQAVMGHAPTSGDMSAVYRQGVSDARLKAATDFVRVWLFDDTEVKSPEQSSGNDSQPSN